MKVSEVVALMLWETEEFVPKHSSNKLEQAEIFFSTSESE